MPKGVYQRKKGYHLFNKWKENIRNGNKGKPHLSMRGDKNPMKRLEVREKLMGDKNPAKRIEVRKKISDKLKGRPHPWSMGDKNPMRNPKFIKKNIEAKKGNHYPKMSEARKGKYNSEESKIKNREWHILHPNRKFKNTSIELKVEEELKRRGIIYQPQWPLFKVAIVDFYLPEYRIVIQCDGDYWHNLSGVREKDKRQDKILTLNGLNVHRFWEHEINEDVKKCLDTVKV